MRVSLPSLLACALAAQSVSAQTIEVGLTMDGGVLPVIYGQDCGPVPCTPFLAGPIGLGQSRLLTHFGAPQTLYVIAIGLPAPCTPIPGIDNALLLAGPIVLDWGLTTSPPFVPLPCALSQGVASFSFTVPPMAPTGITIRFQSLGVSNSGVLALSPTIETITV